MTNSMLGEVHSEPLAHHFDTHFINDLTQQMQKFAVLQLSDQHTAEDVVQESLAGAIKNITDFKGRAALKTWVFAILKNKIADVLRQKTRQNEALALLSAGEEQENFSELFNESGHWNIDDRPAQWGKPEEVFEQEAFWAVFDICLNKLPANQGKIFMAREFLGLNSDEICTAHELSVSNLHVQLHRARLRLRECLEHSWFEQKDDS